ncbi:hypothetical protein HN858_04610 [Candidatus Falkowbacteria bacterium]|jgi:hypothetical protein|nr:hypothetical protein [Candidatus Falkowbacteria bacterium]MBT5503524.1 hypothetical protein [Candidatus Falkowbacteria bacterium]MBT6574409.1 hypothetical protein [Candidatus Falkowbacteria bacterium]MBT7348926.1 hypothetical protein [Candidatus Falkowbacteria bacterium]MBT7501282.1 hypothetical protein [Candidatus Falkowbacteria bacterium]
MKKLILVLFVLISVTACGAVETNENTKKNEPRRPIVENEVPVVQDEDVILEKEPVSASEGLETDFELEKWQDASFSNLAFTFKYHKNWYYGQFMNDEKTVNSIAIVGFGDSADIFDTVETEDVAPIEFNTFGKTQDPVLYSKLVSNTPDLVSEDDTYFGKYDGKKKVFTDNGQEKVVVYFEQDTVVYAIYGNSEFSNIIEQMAYTFKFNNDEE